MHFPAIRRIALGTSIHRGRLTRGDLIGYGDYSLEEADLSSTDLEEITESAFESSPSLRTLNLANNRIRRLDRTSFRPIGRSLQTLDLSHGLRMRNLQCEHLFDDLHSLLNLNLMGNEMESLSLAGDCFRNLMQLKVLVLDFNSLRTIA